MRPNPRVQPTAQTRRDWISSLRSAAADTTVVPDESGDPYSSTRYYKGPAMRVSIPVLVRLRARIWSVKKWWNLTVRGSRRYERIFVDGTAFDQAKSDHDFLLGLHLLRFTSRIRSYQRIYLRIPNDGQLPNTQDRENVNLLLGATLYEGLKDFAKLQNELRKLKSFDAVVPVVKRLNRALSSAKSDVNPALEVLRNKVVFHFDREILPEALSKIRQTPPFDLLLGATGRNADIIYPLIEDALLSFMISKDTGSGTDFEKYDNLLSNMLRYGEELVHVNSKLALELLEPWIRVERAPLQRARSWQSGDQNKVKEDEA